MNMPASKKLTGLVICLVALLLLVVFACVAIAIWGVPSELFISIGGMIMSLGGAHQTAQAAADRSPYYNPPPTLPNLTPDSPKPPPQV